MKKNGRLVFAFTLMIALAGCTTSVKNTAGNEVSSAKFATGYTTAPRNKVRVVQGQVFCGENRFGSPPNSARLEISSDSKQMAKGTSEINGRYELSFEAEPGVRYFIQAKGDCGKTQQEILEAESPSKIVLDLTLK